MGLRIITKLIGNTVGKLEPRPPRPGLSYGHFSKKYLQNHQFAL